MIWKSDNEIGKKSTYRWTGSLSRTMDMQIFYIFFAIYGALMNNSKEPTAGCEPQRPGGRNEAARQQAPQMDKT